MRRKGPIAGRKFFRQVVVIPTDSGNVELPTAHVVAITNDRTLPDNREFIPINALSSQTIEGSSSFKALFSFHEVETTPEPIEVRVEFPAEDGESNEKGQFLALPDIGVSMDSTFHLHHCLSSKNAGQGSDLEKAKAVTMLKTWNGDNDIWNDVIVDCSANTDAWKMVNADCRAHR